jgi:hypothetical protein
MRWQSNGLPRPVTDALTDVVSISSSALECMRRSKPVTFGIAHPSGQQTRRLGPDTVCPTPLVARQKGLHLIPQLAANDRLVLTFVIFFMMVDFA